MLLPRQEPKNHQDHFIVWNVNLMFLCYCTIQT